MERQLHRKVMVFRPLYAVGGQDLGFLPGSENEKMSPWGQAVFDTLGALTTQEVVEEIADRGMLEVLPLTHIRGDGWAPDLERDTAKCASGMVRLITTSTAPLASKSSTDCAATPYSAPRACAAAMFRSATARTS